MNPNESTQVQHPNLLVQSEQQPKLRFYLELGIIKVPLKEDKSHVIYLAVNFPNENLIILCCYLT